MRDPPQLLWRCHIQPHSEPGLTEQAHCRFIRRVVKRATAHFHPRTSKIVSWFKFNSRAQHPGESIAAYVVELHKMFEFCKYGKSLDDMLCDRLVCVLAEQRVQQCLLEDGTLPLTGP